MELCPECKNLVTELKTHLETCKVKKALGKPDLEKRFGDFDLKK